jgi:NADH:ubiquinone reductase (H+-translocating)
VEQARILLIDRADAVGPELGVGPRPVIEAALREARVELHLAVAVAALTRDRVVLADGETIDADAVVLLTTGMVPTPSRVSYRASTTPWGGSWLSGRCARPPRRM